MGHDHSHHHGHHAATPDADRRYLAAALALIVAFMAGEVVVGILASSLALLSDAAHMLTDAGALALALVAIKLADRPPRGGYTFGLKRVEILSAQANGVTLLILGALIVYEGVTRLIEPPTVDGALVLYVALAGIAVNVGATWLVSKAERRSLNVEGAFQHILTDLFAFIGTAIAGAVIMLTGFQRADGIAALIIAGLMLRAGVVLVRESGRVLLEAAPRGIDPQTVGEALAAFEGVVEVRSLHVWEVTSGFPALSSHIVVEQGCDCHAMRRELEGILHDRFGVSHTTLQVDHAADRSLIEIERPNARDAR